jgi:hypothetical protein
MAGLLDHDRERHGGAAAYLASHGVTGRELRRLAHRMTD